MRFAKTFTSADSHSSPEHFMQHINTQVQLSIFTHNYLPHLVAAFSTMGFQPKMPYPKWVWSPVGGMYCEYPKNWQRNSAILVVTWLACNTAIFFYSASIERRPIPPIRPIPSQRWCKYAEVDDPSMKERV